MLRRRDEDVVDAPQRRRVLPLPDYNRGMNARHDASYKHLFSSPKMEERGRRHHPAQAARDG
ncbi:hypothetical protein [Tepidiphilus margaritifer]|uniref:hypothetical protein n=1 Tax=Tepidiphilus margaritifer TaxID=203471 RepID=UPI00040BA2DB|nr:hypothetical protein [Tepidiphilus margaritifer]